MIVRFTKRAEKELDALAPTLKARIWTQINNLQKFAYPRGSAKLKGSDDIYRIRVGTYRILYVPNKKQITIMRVRHRKDVYR